MAMFETFKTIFQRAVVESDTDALTNILKDSKKYFLNISRESSELILTVLFDRKKGLLYFIRNVLTQSVYQKKFETAIKEAYHLLEFIMEQFSAIFEPYIQDTKEVCQVGVMTNCSSYIQKAAASALNKLIELFKDYEMYLGDVVETFVSLFHKSTIAERSLLLSVLGTISKHNPEVPEIQEKSKAIFNQIRNDFKKQYKPRAMSQPVEIQIYLDVLKNVIEQLPTEVKENHRVEIYNWVKDLSRPERYSTKKVTMRSAINLLCCHIQYFDELVYRDYKFWYSLFIKLVQEKGVHSDCGQYALKRFYKLMGNMLKQKNSEDDKAVFMHFKNIFEEELKNNHCVDSNMLRFIVYGFSQMAAPCKRYLTDAHVNHMFSLIAHSAMPLCYRENLGQEELESICYYQNALSEIILHTTGLSIDQINTITKLSILLIKRFPDVSLSVKNVTIFTLINTIVNIGSTNTSLLEEFLHNLIHDGVIWTCSHTLFVDAELQRGLKNVQERPVCYKNYLQLWSQLLMPSRYKNHTQIVQKVVDSMMDGCIILIDKLNLNTKTKEDSVFSDVALSQSAENEADFRIFVNLIDLYVDIINGLESNLLTNTMYKFLFKIVSMSHKHPLISGFYKLIRANFKHIENLSKDQVDTEIIEMLYKCLMNVLDVISTFSNELLTTCLYLILNAPIMYLETIANRTIPVFKIAFTLGLSDFELASTALGTLEKWTSRINSRDVHQLLREVLPFLEAYLQSKESSTDVLQDIINAERKVIKRIILYDDENTLERFQMRILSFMASIDSDILTNFVYERSMDTGATWDKKDLLKYSLPFPDVKIDIYFDKILPRLITLAQNSGDRRTKVIAGEVLYSVVAFILGKTSQHVMTNQDRFVTIYKILCPALLNLGCESDEVVRQLFQPLTLQLTHWLSSKFMLESSATMCFLDSLFKALSSESNTSLREFSGMCLAEFTNWSIKQSDNEAKTKTNIHMVIRKMTNFALHPSMSKRIAGAIAFNHLYTILREDEHIVTIYWLEIFYCFIKSLNGCNDPSITNALNHVQRVLIVKADTLNVKFHGRRKPHEFDDATLTDAMNWLFMQCACLDEHCRKKCMKIFMNCSRCVKNCDSPQAVIKSYVDNHGIETLNSMILKDLKSRVENLSIDNVSPLLKSFDCYIWLIRNNLIDGEYLFANANSKREFIFNCAKNFVYLINKIRLKENQEDVLILTNESEQLQTIQCKVIITMFDFLQTLLDLNGDFIPKFFFDAELFELIAKCVMHPQAVGFDTKNPEIAEMLPPVLESLLCSIMQITDEAVILQIKDALKKCVEKHIDSFLDLPNVLNLSTIVELKQYVKGLMILDRCNILSQLYENEQVLKHPEDKVRYIFQALSEKRVETLIRVNIKPSVVDYLQSLMELLLVHYEPSISKTLIELIANDTVLGPCTEKIAHGVYFLTIFKDVLFGYLLKDVEKTIQVFDDLLQENRSLLLTVMEDLLLFVQRHKKELNNVKEVLVNTIVTKFEMFERAVNNLEDRKQQLISIYGIAVHLKNEPTELLSMNEAFYVWILNQLTDNSDIEHKICVLQNFLVCLTDMTNNKPELVSILRTLRNDRIVLWPNNVKEQNIKVLKVINCFQTLLTLLPVTKSTVVFESLILFAAGIGDQLCNEKTCEYFQNYFACISTEYALRSIEIAYKLFMNLNTCTDERFDILHRFLLPLFQFCKIVEIERFFERNIKEIHTIIRQSLLGSTSDIKQLIASKIGCYDLVAIMFAKIPINMIVSTDSIITRNAISDIKTGKELLQSLYSCALNVRTLKTADPENKEIMRLLHCSAYNCSIAIVCLKEEEDFYLSIFAENRKKQQLIWENIVDCDKKYKLEQTFKEYPKNRKKLVNIRNSMKQNRGANRYSYIHSYNLSASTLNEDINAYDFNEMAVRAKPEENEESMSLTFEYDDLNNHECMASICGALTHIISTEISVIPTEGDTVMPKWLKCFCSSITSANHHNVRLFMLKIILNMQSIFKPYAKYFLPPIMRAVYLYLKAHDFNYIIADVLILLVDWHTVTVPDESNDKILAQKMLEIIVHKVMTSRANEIPNAVRKYNYNIIKMILEVWHDCLKVPDALNEKIRDAPEAAVYLILICLANGMERQIVEGNHILEFLQQSFENWQNLEERVLQICECFGLILKFMEDDDEVKDKKCAIIDRIRSTLRQMQLKCENRQIKCIRAICKKYPKVAVSYLEFVIANISRVDALGKANCLETFLLCIPYLDVERITRELAYMKFPDFLKNKVSLCEMPALQIIDNVIPIFAPSNLLEIANLVTPYVKHISHEYRNRAYCIFMNIYKKYVMDTSENEDLRKLMNMSTEILLAGMLCPSEDVQEKLLMFWSQDAQLTENSKERLLQILNIYTPNVGDTFVLFILLMMLKLTEKSITYTQKLFVPLHNCRYTDYEIAFSWRTKNLGSIAPLFAPSLASQLNQTFTQTSATLPNISFDPSRATSSRSSNVGFGLYETQEPEFEPTIADEESTLMSQGPEYDSVFKVPKVPQPIQNKKSRRFLKTSSNTEAIREAETKKNVHHAEMIKEETVRQRSSVKLYRKYRIGDFPDIEISHSNLIEPLQQLAKMDQLICKDLAVSIVCSLLGEQKSDGFAEKVSETLKSIIHDSNGSSTIVATVLEIMIVTNMTNCSAESITKVSKLNNLNFLGSLVLEQNLIDGIADSEPVLKKARIHEVTDTSHKWLQLTSLYESMNDVDVVLSIFKSHIEDENMRDAAFAQAANDWFTAKNAYEKAYESGTEIVKEHSLQGLLECSSNLCRWNKIEKYVHNKLNGDLNKIWNDPWKDWMFPWLLEIQIRKVLNNDISDSFQNDVKVFSSWLNNEEKKNHLECSFGDFLAMFLIPEQLEAARESLLNTLDKIREEWIRLHPHSVQLRIRTLQEVRLINDINLIVRILKSGKPSDNLQDIFKFWSNSVPSAQDAILPWDKLTSHRIFFASLINEKLKEWEQNPTVCDSQSISNIEESYRSLSKVSCNMQVKMIEAALNQKNKFIAKKYVMQLEQNLTECSIDLKHQFLLMTARIKYLNGEMESDVRKKLEYYSLSLKHSHALLDDKVVDSTTIIGGLQHTSKVASRIIQLSEGDSTFADLLPRNDVILEKINPTDNDLSSIKTALHTYSFNHLKECCNIATTRPESCYFKLAKYCYDRLSHEPGNTQLQKEFVYSTLRSMSYGSLEAAHYFPCLLKPEYFEDEDTKELFVKECKEIETWLFLSWQAQLFSHLGTPIGPLIIPILERIVETYPNAIIYTIRLTIDRNAALLNDPKTYQIRQVLYNKPEVEQFLTAMQYVVQPELYLEYHLRELKNNLSLGTATAIDKFLKQVYPNMRENKDVPKPGGIYNEITRYKNKIKQLENKNPDQIKQQIELLIQNIKESCKRKRKDTAILKDYSPWLHEYSGGDLEVPGQYSGNRKPIPKYHAKIMKFEPTVKLMESLRKPVRITMIGNDAKEYNFLVKFGEDLRMDQRVQQLFTIMNKTLHRDAACRQRHLSIDTYQVIPLSRTLGLIQWIEDTRSLDNLVHFTLAQNEINRYHSLCQEYQGWIKSAAPRKKEYEQYKEATVKNDAAKAITKMDEFVSKTKWNGLRDALTVLSPSLESFITLRRNFVITYATMCIVHWILGIGDRHLGNILVTVGSGRCLGIDFSLAFDAGVDLRIPELMPFRLTPQILGLLKPFTEKDLLGAIMTHTLRALRKEQGPILACLDVFVHEPLDWTEHLNKALKESEGDYIDVKWLPKKKISVVTQKLNGIQPSLITVEQLKDQHNDKYFDRYYAIVTGNDDTKRLRITMKNCSLTPEEQVECLLDQATDYNILGRTYVGWKPWL